MTAAATARVDAPEPRVFVKAGTIAARATISAPRVVVRSGLVLAMALVEPHPHIAAGHDDPVALVTDFGLVLVVFFVAGKLVACRLVRLRR